jgi:hypothetical protein
MGERASARSFLASSWFTCRKCRLEMPKIIECGCKYFDRPCLNEKSTTSSMRKTDALCNTKYMGSPPEPIGNPFLIRRGRCRNLSLRLAVPAEKLRTEFLCNMLNSVVVAKAVYLHSSSRPIARNSENTPQQLCCNSCYGSVPCPPIQLIGSVVTSPAEAGGAERVSGSLAQATCGPSWRYSA